MIIEKNSMNGVWAICDKCGRETTFAQSFFWDFRTPGNHQCRACNGVEDRMTPAAKSEGIAWANTAQAIQDRMSRS